MTMWRFGIPLLRDDSYRTDRLMQHLGVSALFLGVIYVIVTLIVWRGVKRVFRETTTWNTLKIFCLALIIVPLLRASSFIVHFLIYEGEILHIDTPQYIKDIIMNSLYVIPTFIFIFTYMVLICIWIEITMFSRDQYLIQHDRYGKIWKWVYGVVCSFIFVALIFIFSWGVLTENYSFITAVYTSLWVMTFVVPVFAFFVWIILVIRFAGFPYLNDVWKKQTIRMFYVVCVWSGGQLISGTMTTVWSEDEGDWMKKDDYIWFIISVSLTLIFAEILPLIYTSDWHRMGFLLMAFVNWRDLWLRNQSHALAHDPRLIDDPFQKTNNPNSSELEFKPFSTTKTNYNSLARNLLTDNDASPYVSPNAFTPLSDLTTPRMSRDQLNSTGSTSQNNKRYISKHRKIDFSQIIIDTNLIIPTYTYSNCNAYYSTHRAKLPNSNKTESSKSKSSVSTESESDEDDKSDNDDEYDCCLKIFEVDNIDTAMIEPIIENLQKFKKLKHDNLGIIYDVNIAIDDNRNTKRIQILSPWYGGGSLFDIIDMSPKDTPFAMHVIKRMILQIATFMDWLHTECKIPHGHLKSRNILFDNAMNVCITDIGLISLKKTMTVMLPDANFEGYWMDKDYFQGKSINQECDVWAFGYILYELITKKQPFDDTNDMDQIKKCIISNDLPVLPKHCSSFMRKLIESCWNEDRSQRPSFQKIVQMIQTNI